MMVSVMANETLRGRALHTEKAETKSTKGFTDIFCMSDKCHAEAPEFEGANLIGLAVGFTVTAGFMIFGVIVIIRDEIKRHKDYAADLINDVHRLEAAGASEQMIKDINRAFYEKENAKKKSAAELEKERLELMAKN